jgi:enoyl-CoA hydratase/carnithine racemase
MDLNIRREKRVLRITLTRPAKRNALTSEMCAGFVKAVNSAQNTRDIGAILIDAEGHVFSAGMDLEEAVERTAIRRIAVHEKLFTLGMNSLKPIVICVAGHALGGGLGLVAQGHVVVAAEGSLFGLTEIRIGLWPFVVYRAVEAALGARRTQELALTGRLFSSQDAANWGLVHQLSPPSELADRAAAIANDLARSSPEAIKLGMQYVRASRGKTWAKAGEIANAARAKLMRSRDFAEGVAAFKQKRNPRWPSMPKSSYTESEPNSSESASD